MVPKFEKKLKICFYVLKALVRNLWFKFSSQSSKISSHQRNCHRKKAEQFNYWNIELLNDRIYLYKKAIGILFNSNIQVIVFLQNCSVVFLCQVRDNLRGNLKHRNQAFGWSLKPFCTAGMDMNNAFLHYLHNYQHAGWKSKAPHDYRWISESLGVVQ